MNFLKQVVLAALFVCVAAFAWGRLDDNAASRMQAAGVPPSVVILLAGADEADASDPAGTRGTGGKPEGGRRRGPPESIVVTSTVGSDKVDDRVSALGDGEALRSVTVVPLSSGVIQEVAVKSGELVEEGSVLAVLDSETETIQRDRAQLAVSTAQEKADRYERLVGSRAASEVQLTDARDALANAKLELRDAELKLERRKISAPISGYVGIMPVEKGDYVTTQNEIATLDDRSKILVDFWVPERFADKIKPGQEVEASAVAVAGETFHGTVAAIASRIDKDSRTLAVRAEIANEGDRLRPGMSFRVTIRFTGDVHPALDPLALQWSSDGPYVWKIADGKAIKVAVNIVQRNSDAILVDGEIAQGDSVVIEGVQSVRQGAPVKVARNVDEQAASGS